MKREIVVVTPTLANNGAERVLSLLVNKWIEDEVTMKVLVVRSDVFNQEFGFQNSIEVIVPRFSGGKYSRFIRAILWVYRYIKEHQDCYVVSFLEYTQCMLSVLKPFLNNKFLYSERNNPYLNPRQKWYRWFRNFAFLTAPDKIVFQTQDAMEYFSKSVQKKGVIIPNPIDCSILPDRFVGERRKVIIAAGRLEPQKNFVLLLKSFAKFFAEHPDYTLEIYGRGKLEQELKELAQKLEIADKVKMPGFATDIHDKMRDCAMYVSSSDYEGISNSMLEAMALGMPVICTDCPIGGARQTITDGVDGLLVPVGDVDAMYWAMKRVVEEPGLAERLGREAYKVRERYPIEKIAQQWLEAMFN